MDYKDITSSIAEVARHYHYQQQPGILIYIQELIARVLRFIKDLLASLQIMVPGLADTRAVGNVMQIILFIAGLVAVLAIIYFVYKRMSQINEQSIISKRGQLGFEAMLDATAWRKQGEDLASKGEWREACRALYFSLMREMSEREILEFVPTRTNYEYWYALSHNKPLAVVFRQIADIVEVSWFGYYKAQQSDYQACLKLLEQAEAEMSARKAAAAK